MNHKVYYIKITVELPVKGKITVRKTLFTSSQNQNIDAVRNSSVDMGRIKRDLKTDKFTVVEVEPIRILSGW